MKEAKYYMVHQNEQWRHIISFLGGIRVYSNILTTETNKAVNLPTGVSINRQKRFISEISSFLWMY